VNLSAVERLSALSFCKQKDWDLFLSLIRKPNSESQCFGHLRGGALPCRLMNLPEGISPLISLIGELTVNWPGCTSLGASTILHLLSTPLITYGPTLWMLPSMGASYQS